MSYDKAYVPFFLDRMPVLLEETKILKEQSTILLIRCAASLERSQLIAEKYNV